MLSRVLRKPRGNHTSGFFASHDSYCGLLSVNGRIRDLDLASPKQHGLYSTYSLWSARGERPSSCGAGMRTAGRSETEPKLNALSSLFNHLLQDSFQRRGKSPEAQSAHYSVFFPQRCRRVCDLGRGHQSETVRTPVFSLMGGTFFDATSSLIQQQRKGFGRATVVAK